MFRGPHTIETKRRLSELAKNREVEPPHPKGKNHPMWGKKHSPETLRKISQANKGKKTWHGLSPERQNEVRGKISKANSGNRNGMWKGGFFINEDGYKLILKSEHPDANLNGYMFEHRLVMEQKIGRRLNKWENVHHLNGIKTDNHPENLELWLRPQPRGIRIVDLIKYYAKNPLYTSQL